MLETILPNEQHLGRVSNCCGDALSLALIFRLWVLLHLRFLKKRVESCEEDSLSSLLPFSSSCNWSCLKDGLDVKTTTSMEYKLFPITWNCDVPHQPWCNHVSTSVSLNCTDVLQGLFEILAVLEPRLVISFINMSKPILFLKNLVLLYFQILASVLDLSYSNELLHQYLAHLDIIAHQYHHKFVESVVPLNDG